MVYGGEKYSEMDIKLSELLDELSNSVQKQLSRSIENYWMILSRI